MTLLFVVPDEVDTASLVHGEREVDDVLKHAILVAVPIPGRFVIAFQREIRSDLRGLAVKRSRRGTVDCATVKGFECPLRPRAKPVEHRSRGALGALATLDQAHRVGDSVQVRELLLPTRASRRPLARWRWHQSRGRLLRPGDSLGRNDQRLAKRRVVEAHDEVELRRHGAGLA